MKELKPKPGSWKSNIDDPCPVFITNHIRARAIEIGAVVLAGYLLVWVIVFALDSFGFWNFEKL